ncbi:MAG: hypothetical protein EPN99_00305 [Frankiales bacterium]|nr:MAG: hypothetical protein EPN99_00305 [Frankiales bacterium]
MDDAATLLPVGPWALAAVATVLVVALSVPPGGPRPADVGAPAPPLRSRWAALAAAVAAVVLLVVARTGPDSELDNPAPALVVGLGWPLLLLLPALAGLLGLVQPTRSPAAATVDARPAVAVAVVLAGAFVLPDSATRPDLVGTVVAAYALAVLAGSVAVGRAAVTARAEVLGLLASWLAVGRGLPRWSPPRGALAVLAAFLGAAWFERYERTATWAAATPDRTDAVLGLAAALALAGAGALLLHLATRRRGAPGTAAAVLLPLVAGTALACVARRALISAQLLADQLAGPRAVEPDPLGVAGGQVLALALVVLGGGLAGAVLARRTGQETARLPGVGVLLALSAASAWLVLQP